jgi:hypothetical protein
VGATRLRDLEVASFAALPMVLFVGAFVDRPVRVPGQVEPADFCASAQLNGQRGSDATACIQAAIDYAFTNNIGSVHCPEYAVLDTSGTIWKDPPGNLHANLTRPGIFGWTMKLYGNASPAQRAMNARSSPATTISWSSIFARVEA